MNKSTPRKSDVIKDFSDFKVNIIYGTKVLTGTDSVILGLIRRSLKEEVAIGTENIYQANANQ